MLRLIPAARAVNDGMPIHVAALTEKALQAAGVSLKGARIAVLGYAYLEESDDTRNSPSEALVDILRRAGAEVLIHDPWVPEFEADLWETLAGCDAAVLMVAHQAYRSLDLAALKSALRRPVLVDGRHLIDPKKAQAAGLVFAAVGYGISPS